MFYPTFSTKKFTLCLTKPIISIPLYADNLDYFTQKI